MRLRVSDPTLIPDLVEFLDANEDVVVDVEGDQLELSLIGSFALDAMRMELMLRIRAWEAARRARGAEVPSIDLIEVY
jgi:hypothetical protein